MHSYNENCPIKIIWHYFLEDEDPNEELYEKYYMKLEKTTLGKIKNTSIFDARILQSLGTQQNVLSTDFINEIFMNNYTKAYEKYVNDKNSDKRNYSEKYWKIREKFNYNPQDYINIIKKITESIDKVPITECCQQDIEIFGNEYMVSAYVEDKDGQLIYRDWILSDQGGSKRKPLPRELNKNEYFEDISLIKLYEILKDQEQGIYQKAEKRGTILQFPGIKKNE